MASYPSIGLRFSIAPMQRRNVDVSDEGTVRSVDLNEATTFRISVIHPLIEASDVSTLTTFYDTYRDSANTITLGGDTYDVYFERDYDLNSDSSTRFTMKTTLVGTRQ